MKVNEGDRRSAGSLPDVVTLFAKDVGNLRAETLTREEELKLFSRVENGRAGYLLLKLLAPSDPWVKKEFKGYLSNESAQEFLSTTGYTPYFKTQENIVKTKQKGNKPKEEDSDKGLEFDGDTAFVLTNPDHSFTDNDLTLLRRYIDEGKEAKEQIANHILRWVISRVFRFEGQGLDKDELIQEGNMGVLIAIGKFDRRRGFRFLTYATHWIDQAVGRARADASRTIRLPVYMHELIGRFFKIQSMLINRLGRYPTDIEIAEEWGIPIEEIIKIRQALGRVKAPDSLDRLEEGEEFTARDFVPDTSIPDFGDVAARNERAERIRKVLEAHPKLSRKEVQVISLRFGLDGEGAEERTLGETGKILGLSRERVRQIVDGALGKMRRIQEIRQLAEK